MVHADSLDLDLTVDHLEWSAQRSGSSGAATTELGNWRISRISDLLPRESIISSRRIKFPQSYHRREGWVHELLRALAAVACIRERVAPTGGSEGKEKRFGFGFLGGFFFLLLMLSSQFNQNPNRPTRKETKMGWSQRLVQDARRERLTDRRRPHPLPIVALGNEGRIPVFSINSPPR